MRSCSLLLSVVVVLCLAFLVPTPTVAQITNVTDIEATPMPGTGHDYIKMLNETVNPASGSLSVRIEVPIPKARGLTVPFGFSYDSNGTFLPGDQGNGVMYWNNGDYGNPLSKGGWRYTAPQVTLQYASKSGYWNGYQVACNYLTGFMFNDPKGSRHALHLSVWSNVQN